jgi:hypothetical protein
MIWSLIFFILLLWPAASWGACTGSSPTWTATVDQASVTTCVNNAVNGDTVNIAVGAANWTSTLTINKHIKLAGAGVGQTIITNNNTTGNLLNVTESTTGNVRIEGIQFNQGTGPVLGGTCGGPCAFLNVASGGANGKPVLVVGNRFDQTVGTAGDAGWSIAMRVNRGVISGNTIEGLPKGTNCANTATGIGVKLSDAEAALVWSTPAPWGALDTNGDKHVYVETNTLKNMFNGIDNEDGARTVFRYNTITNFSIGGHGADTSKHGQRYEDIYQNTIHWDGAGPNPVRYNCGQNPPTIANPNHHTNLRGGTQLIHENVINGIGPSSNWGNNPEVRIQFQNLRRKGGPYACWKGELQGSERSRGPHQAGWGFITGATTPLGTTGNPPGRVTPRNPQDREPVYIWGNTGTAGQAVAISFDNFSPDQCGGGHVIADYVKMGQEVIVGTPKPGYAPFQYPHPLLTGAPPQPPTPRAGLHFIPDALLLRRALHRGWGLLRTHFVHSQPPGGPPPAGGGTM